ncbi:MAG: NADH-quinone oxidoreductase subunit B family protein [Planctomycetota bacterium]
MASGEVNLVWLQAGGCTGCSVSFLNSAHPSTRNLLVDQLLPGVHLSLKYHCTVMAGQGEAALRILDGLPRGDFVLVMEGSLPKRELFCTVGCANGEELTAMDKFLQLAPEAALVLAVGTCSSFGGIPAGAPNPGGYRSAGDVMEEHGIETPLLNVPGCPPHPD